MAAGAKEAPAKLARIKEAHDEEARVTKKRDYDDDDDENESISIEEPAKMGGYRSHWRACARFRCTYKLEPGIAKQAEWVSKIKCTLEGIRVQLSMDYSTI